MCHLNDLPVVVDKPGTYITRNGKTVIVHEIKPSKHKDKSITEFLVKGSLIIRKNNRVRYHYDIWHVSGRFEAVIPCDMDIIGKEEQCTSK